jgi:uncharacterized membrane protein
MSQTNTIIGLVVCMLLGFFGIWRQKRHRLGDVPLISPFYIQLIALIGFFVFAAHLFSITTGIEWTPPRRGP